MQILEHDEYLALRADARVLTRDRYGDKVLALADGTILKLFRRKRLISSAAWYPYARRFADNARALAARGIPCPEVTGLYRLPSVRRDAVRVHDVRSMARVVRMTDAVLGRGTDD